METAGGAKKHVFLLRRKIRSIVDEAYRYVSHETGVEAGPNFSNEAIPYRQAAIIGNPGMGKSAGLAYALHLALSHKRTVVYDARSISALFAFLPQPSSETGGGDVYQVWKTTTPPKFCPAAYCKLVEMSATILVQDCDGSLVYGGSSRLLARACDPSFRPVRRCETYIAGCLSWSEFRVFAHFFHPLMERSEVLQRFVRLGGTIRYALASRVDFDRFLVEREEEAKRLSYSEVIEGPEDFTETHLFALSPPDRVGFDRFGRPLYGVDFLSGCAAQHVLRHHRDYFRRLFSENRGSEVRFSMEKLVAAMAVEVVRKDAKKLAAIGCPGGVRVKWVKDSTALVASALRASTRSADSSAASSTRGESEQSEANTGELLLPLSRGGGVADPDAVVVRPRGGGLVVIKGTAADTIDDFSKLRSAIADAVGGDFKFDLCFVVQMPMYATDSERSKVRVLGAAESRITQHALVLSTLVTPKAPKGRGLLVGIKRRLERLEKNAYDESGLDDDEEDVEMRLGWKREDLRKPTTKEAASGSNEDERKEGESPCKKPRLSREEIAVGDGGFDEC
jgi:hypothetical protein